MANFGSLVYAEAIAAAFLWAISAPIISYGLRSVREGEGKLFPVLFGINLAALVGFALLTLIRGFPSLEAVTDPNVFWAGAMTFPLGTGLYYIASVAFGNKASIAAQFANVKPLIVVMISAVMFDEVLDTSALYAVALIAVGVAVITIGALKKSADLVAIVLGFTLATVWAMGEGFVKAASQSFDRFEIAHAALTASLPLSLVALVGGALLRRQKIEFPGPKVLLAFSCHGAISFAGAYYFFFSSIANIGLSETILVTTFWPTLALATNYIINRNIFAEVPRYMYLGMALFTLASLLKVLTQT